MSQQTLSEQNKTSVPPSATFDLILTKTIEGQPVLPNARCTFSYNWNFTTNTGSAQLVSINGATVNIPLYPLGIEGYLDFMSDMQPTAYSINGQQVIINRVILDIKLSNNDKAAAILFNQDGSTLEATDHFLTEKVKQLRS